MSKERLKPHERIAQVKRRAEAGPVILQNSFRPFFLLAGLWATLAVPLWVLTFFGMIPVSDDFDALLWHQHEMLFGFAAAAICGFVLTAIPNWTGRLPVSGGRLLVLVILWVLGRVAMLALPLIGPAIAALLDVAFLTALSVLIGRELVSGKNWRNLPVLALISLFGLGNWLIHFELLGLVDTAAVGFRLSTFVLAILVALIGGRVVPSFTRNWLVQKGAEALPAPMNGLDKVALLALVVLMIAEVFLPDAKATAGLAILAGILIAARLLRWQGWAVRSEPLLWIMHVGYAWLALGLIMTGLAGLSSTVPPSAAIHTLTTGAFSTMILAVMTRASLGHTGRELTAGPGTQAVFIFVTIAALARVIVPFLGDLQVPGIWLSGIAWTVGFGLFTVLYFPVFTQPRVQPRMPNQVPK
jgi:uncharacterized protein involved in response to NO